MAECLISGAGIILGYAFGIGTWVIFFALKKAFVNEAIRQLKEDNFLNGAGKKATPKLNKQKQPKKDEQNFIDLEGDLDDENMGKGNSE